MGTPRLDRKHLSPSCSCSAAKHHPCRGIALLYRCLLPESQAPFWQVCKELGSRWLVTADHGNADDMVQRNKKDKGPAKDKEGKILTLTSHTLAPVRTSPGAALSLSLSIYLSGASFGLSGLTSGNRAAWACRCLWLSAEPSLRARSSGTISPRLAWPTSLGPS